MAAVDAQQWWLSQKVPNDQFLLYLFGGTPDTATGLEQLRRNAQGCAELRLRVCDDDRWRYPRWVPGEVGADQFVVHDAAPDWRDCLPALAGLDPLDTTRMTWRAHIFPPGVVVVQMSHALGDGTRSSALAAALLGRVAPVPAVADPDRGFLPWRSVVAARAHRVALRDLPPPTPPRPVLSVNARPAAASVRHTIAVDRDRLSHPTVTVGALSAIGEALGGYLAARGEDIGRLGAEVPMAGPPPADARSRARNNFRNVGVGLYPELDRHRRAARIAADLDAQRRRNAHPATAASAAAFAAVPAPVLRWGMSRFDPAARSDTVAAHTVVSSVNRGPADLSFGGAPVLLTAGYPALSPMMSMTHGVHGIGGTVAVSVHADPVNVDVEDYLNRLRDALGCRP